MCIPDDFDSTEQLLKYGLIGTSWSVLQNIDQLEAGEILTNHDTSDTNQDEEDQLIFHGTWVIYQKLYFFHLDSHCYIGGSYGFILVCPSIYLSLYPSVFSRKVQNVPKTTRQVKFLFSSYSVKCPSLKLVSAIFYQIFVFSPNDSTLKTMENVFYFIEKALLVLKMFKF